jgi:drug/metabolite transporter (DMT)-like permease
MPYLLALSSAFLYGAADFLGGLTARRADTIGVVLVAQFAGLLVLALLMPLLPAVTPTGSDLLWGASAGVAGSVGVALLYRGLAIGTMAIVAPTTAICALALPVAVSATMGERLSTMAVVGIVLALVGIALVGQENLRETAPPAVTPPAVTPAADAPLADPPPDAHPAAAPAATHAATHRWVPPGLGLAFVSGIAIGCFYLLVARASADAGLWPLLVARGASVTLFGIVAMVGGRSLRMPVSAAATALVAGVIDMLANALYLIATWSGTLSVVVTLASLYPASTVLLARLFLRERMNAWQVAGVVCALVAVLLIVGGS